MLLEELPGRHADDPRGDAVLLQRLIRLDAERDLAARADEQDLRLAVGGIRQHIGTARDAGGRGVARAVERRHRLAAQHQAGRTLVERDDDAPGFRHLVGVGRPQRDHSGNGAERDELLDRLMCRAVFSDPDRIMGEDIDGRHVHDRAQPQRGLQVVAENEIGGAVGTKLGEREPVENRRHGVLADAEVKIAAAILVGFEISGSLEGEAGFGRRREVGGTSDQPGIMRRDGIQHLARGDESRDTLRVGREAGQIAIPAIGEPVRLHALELIGEVRIFGAVQCPFARATSRGRRRGRARRCRRRSARERSRPALETWRPRASHRLVWQGELLLRRAPRHGRRWCPACAEPHSRYGCRR